MSDAPIPIASARDLFADVRSRPVWDGASISPVDAEYPRVHLDWHERYGFVFQCYEHDESWGDFLVTSRQFSTLQLKRNWADKRSNGGRANCSYLLNLRLRLWIISWTTASKIRRSSGSGSMAFRGKSCGKVGHNEKRGNARIGRKISGSPSRYNRVEVKLMTVKAVYENGVFKPREPIHLEEHTEVEVVIPAAISSDADDPTGWRAAEALIGFIDDAPADMAEHHDRYLYGAPKA